MSIFNSARKSVFSASVLGIIALSSLGLGCFSLPAWAYRGDAANITSLPTFFTFFPTIKNTFKEMGELDSEEAAVCMIRDGQTTPFIRSVVERYQGGENPRQLFEGLSDEEIREVMNVLGAFSQ